MRVSCIIDNKKGQIAIDHLRSIDKTRLKYKLTTLDKITQKELINTLIAMFSQ